VVLGLWYQIEVFIALFLVILPEMAILQLGYSAAVKLRNLKTFSTDNILYINNLHWKVQVIGAVTLLLAVFFGYSHEVLL
jgi:K+-transporting ATPase A subunit